MESGWVGHEWNSTHSYLLVENGTVATITDSSPKASGPTETITKHHPLPLHTHKDEGEGCGWLSFKPKFLQRFRTSKWVLFWLCWAAAVQGMVINGFVNVCITTIEKRFNLRSSTTGMIAGCYDVGVVVCSIPVSYLGSLPGASKPRWIGWGILIMGIGSFVFAVPHFSSPAYELNELRPEDTTPSVMLCLREANRSSVCETTSQEWLSNYQYVFLLGQFLHGVGASPLYTLGVAYLDESVPLKMSSFYLGIFHAMAVIGPAAGYVIGGQLLNIYIDVPNLSPKLLGGITKESDQWLGAWWIGFIISGIFAISISWILMAFPAEIPGAKKRASERTCAVDHVSAKAFAHIGHLPGAAKELLKNLPFVFLSLAEASDGALVAGLATFLPKVIENQFGVSAGFAALLVGFIAVPAGGGGTFLGGWVVKYFKLNCDGILKFSFCLSLSCFFCVLGFMMSCPETSFAGITVSYGDRSVSPLSPSLTSLCNVDCECENVTFDPVCGTNKIMYYSPCHAGCQSKTQLDIYQIYSDCKCIKSLPIANASKPLNLKSEDNQLLLPDFSTSRQKCPSECNLLTLFLILLFIVMLMTFLSAMPSMSGTLRCVPDTHRSLALGLQGIQIRLLGTIPGPIIFGYVMDSTCSLWQNTCEGTGSCSHYNNAKISRSLTGVLLIFKALAAIFFFFSWWFYRRKNMGTHNGTETNSCPNGTEIIQASSA